MEILTPGSSRWEKFIEQLNAALTEDGCAGDASDDTHCHAKAVMRDMGGVDIESSLAYFEEHGGYCDCEILLNVDRDWSWLQFAESRITESHN